MQSRILIAVSLIILLAGGMLWSSVDAVMTMTLVPQEKEGQYSIEASVPRGLMVLEYTGPSEDFDSADQLQMDLAFDEQGTEFVALGNGPELTEEMGFKSFALHLDLSGGDLKLKTSFLADAQEFKEAGLEEMLTAFDFKISREAVASKGKVTFKDKDLSELSRLKLSFSTQDGLSTLALELKAGPEMMAESAPMLQKMGDQKSLVKALKSEGFKVEKATARYAKGEGKAEFNVQFRDLYATLAKKAAADPELQTLLPLFEGDPTLTFDWNAGAESTVQAAWDFRLNQPGKVWEKAMKELEKEQTGASLFVSGLKLEGDLELSKPEPKDVSLKIDLLAQGVEPVLAVVRTGGFPLGGKTRLGLVFDEQGIQVYARTDTRLQKLIDSLTQLSGSPMDEEAARFVAVLQSSTGGRAQMQMDKNEGRVQMVMNSEDPVQKAWEIAEITEQSSGDPVSLPGRPHTMVYKPNEEQVQLYYDNPMTWYDGWSSGITLSEVKLSEPEWKLEEKLEEFRQPL